MDTDGIEYAAMFMALDEERVKEHHRLYLKETTPYTYRLCSSKFMTASECSELRIHCPLCGKKMESITAQKSGNYHPSVLLGRERLPQEWCMAHER